MGEPQGSSNKKTLEKKTPDKKSDEKSSASEVKPSALGKNTLDALLVKTPDLVEKKKLKTLFRHYNNKNNTHAVSMWNYFTNILPENQTFSDFFNGFELISHYELPKTEFYEDGTFSPGLKNVFTIKTAIDTPLIVGSVDRESISKIALLFGVKKFSYLGFQRFQKEYDEKKNNEILEKINREKIFDLGDYLLKDRNFLRDAWSKEYDEKFRKKLEISIDKLARFLENAKPEESAERTLFKKLAPNANSLNKIYYDEKTPAEILDIAVKMKKNISSVTDANWRKFNLYLMINTYIKAESLASVIEDINYVQKKSNVKLTFDQGQLLEKKEINLVEFAELMYIIPDLFKRRTEENEQTALNFSFKQADKTIRKNNPFIYMLNTFFNHDENMNEEVFEKYKTIVKKEYLKNYFDIWSFKVKNGSNNEGIYKNAKSIEGMSDFEKITKTFALWQRKIEYFEKTQKNLEGSLVELPLKINVYRNAKDAKPESLVEMTPIEFVNKIKNSYFTEGSELINFKKKKLQKIEDLVSYGLIDEKGKAAVKRRIYVLSRYNDIKSILTSKKDANSFEITPELRDKFVKAYLNLQKINNDWAQYKQEFETIRKREMYFGEEKNNKEKINVILNAKYFDWAGIKDVVYFSEVYLNPTLRKY